MVIKTAYRGRNAGNQFYSCTRFPYCRGTRPVSRNIENKIETLTHKRNTKLKQLNLSSDSKEVQQMDTNTKNKFLKLIRYYKECVQVESLSEIKLWQSDENDDFIQCPSEIEWLSSGKQTYEITNIEQISSFGRKTRWKKRSVNYYYAYPILVKKFTRRDTGENSAFIMPLLIFPVSVEKNSEHIILKRDAEFRPQVNTEILSMYGAIARAEQKRVFIQKLLENWKEDVSYEQNFRAVVLELKEDFGIENFVDSDLDKLSSKKLNLKEVQSGFYATGMIFATQGSQYTFGLEEELDELEKN